MDSRSYLALNAWLQKADNNYLEGRLLWFKMCINGASNLLWLSCEQIIKILLLQKQVDVLSASTNTLEELHQKLESEGKKISHNVEKLIKELENKYAGLQIDKFRPVLEKLQEYFYRRYVVNKGSSIPLAMINEVDEFYFLLRKQIDADIGLGTIDEIVIQRKHNWSHPVEAFKYAYFKNSFFGPRKHKRINIQGPDGKIYKEEGEN